MADIIFKAFLSHSRSAEDSNVIEFFKKVISSFEIQSEVYDYQEIGRIPDKIKERITQSDCLIAIATRRKKIEGSDNWTFADWIQHEIALANAYNKPIAILAEDGVKVEGFIDADERYETFSRENLGNNIHKIITFLFKLRKHLESASLGERFQVPVLLRHYIHAKQEIRSRELIVLRCEILMESLINDLGATEHAITREGTTPGVSVMAKQFDFVCKEKPVDTRVEHQIIRNTDERFLWKVIFNPPLRKGDKVKYAFKETHANYKPWSYEELIERIAGGTYQSTEPICEACEWYISYPTAELTHDFEFPEGYEIKNYYTDVRLGEDVRMKAEDELKRIKEGKFFVAEKLFDKWNLSLKIPKPLQGHLYYTYYQPPKASDLIEFKAAT
jgi:hypothetical protein